MIIATKIFVRADVFLAPEFHLSSSFPVSRLLAAFYLNFFVLNFLLLLSYLFLVSCLSVGQIIKNSHSLKMDG